MFVWLARHNFLRRTPSELRLIIMRFISLLASLVFISAVAQAQEADPFGSTMATSYTIESLPNDFVAAEMTTNRDNLQMLFQMSGVGRIVSPPNDGQPAAFSSDVLLQLTDVIWASKQQYMDNSEFLIGYKLETGRALMRQNPIIPSELAFRIIYVRRQSIISFSPVVEFSPANLRLMATKAPRVEARQVDRTLTLSNLKQIGTGAALLLSDNNNIFPNVQSTKQLFEFMMPYLRNKEVFKTKNPMGGEFRFNMSLAGVSASDIETPAETPLFFESQAWPDGRRCVCYTDTHAKFVTEDEWKKMQPMLKLKLKRHGKPIKPGDPIPPLGTIPR